MNSLPQKKCTKCGITKPLTEYKKDSRIKIGLCASCKECAKEYQKTWSKCNPEKVSQYCRNWKSRNPEKAAQYSKSWYKRNSEKATQWSKCNSERVLQNRRNWCKRNSEKLLQYQRSWRERNPEKATQYGRKRRVAKRGKNGNVSAKEWFDLCEYYGNKCLCCGEEKKLTMDHVLALSADGEHAIENVQPLCQSCNSKKGIKLVDYRPDKGLYQNLQERGKKNND